jgi:uncharacterized protein YyaL (SSP411 family)
LAQHFVSVKVDREERPDVDRVYMTFVQATTGSGGWPMSVWLTPALEPFYGGTYFPPTSRWGRPGFAEILDEIARVWREEPRKVEQSAATILDRLRTLAASGGGTSVPAADVLGRVVAAFGSAFDRRRGGFGGAPKFPRPSELLFLFREHARTGSVEARDMAVDTMRAMALGGMRDHLGGGFHRYSVDADWRVSHFEKMLYDQAQLVLASVEAAQVTGDRFFAEVATNTLDYVRRDLADPDGGFYSAEDADSVPPEQAHERQPRKMEGAFYVWHEQEIRERLGQDADLFCARFGVLPDGNAPADPQGEFTHKNLLYTARTVAELVQAGGVSPEDVIARLERGRIALLARRTERPRPHLDDKVLTAWNGLTIAAFARAARMLDGAGGYLRDAQRAAVFLRTHLWDATSRTLLRRYRHGVAGVEGYAEDYAYLICGLLELFQADGDTAWLAWAVALQRRQDELFGDPIGGGWFSTTGHDASVLLRQKEAHDGAEPAASSVSVFNLLTLSHLVGHAPGDDWLAKIDRTLSSFLPDAAQTGRGTPMMLAALSTYHAGMPQIVIVGDPAATETAALHDVVRRRYLPTALVIPVDPARQQDVETLLPWVGVMRMLEGRATAYVCRQFTCDVPTTDPEDLARWISN